MNNILIPLLQGAGPVALAVVSFALAFTWPSVVEPVTRLTSERARLAGFAGIGALLLLAAAVVYVVPGFLLGDDFGSIAAVPIATTWAIVGLALALRSMLQTGMARVVSAAFSIATLFGVGAGVLVTLAWHHPIAATILPTGAFILIVGAVAGIVAWARPDSELDALAV